MELEVLMKQLKLKTGNTIDSRPIYKIFCLNIKFVFTDDLQVCSASF